MIIERDSIRCAREHEHGMLYTQALVEHWFEREAREGSVRVTVTYPDGTVEELDESSDRVSCDRFVLAYSGAPHVGNGDGMADVEIRYEPADPEFSEIKAYSCYGGGEPPEVPALVFDMADGTLSFHGGDGEVELLASRTTWGILKSLRTWGSV